MIQSKVNIWLHTQSQSKHIYWGTLSEEHKWHQLINGHFSREAGFAGCPLFFFQQLFQICLGRTALHILLNTIAPTHASTSGKNHACLYSPATEIIALWPVLISIPLRAGGWVGLGGWLYNEVVCQFEDGHPSQYQPGLMQSNFVDSVCYHMLINFATCCFRKCHGRMPKNGKPSTKHQENFYHGQL